MRAIVLLALTTGIVALAPSFQFVPSIHDKVCQRKFKLNSPARTCGLSNPVITTLLGASTPTIFSAYATGESSADEGLTSDGNSTFAIFALNGVTGEVTWSTDIVRKNPDVTAVSVGDLVFDSANGLVVFKWVVTCRPPINVDDDSFFTFPCTKSQQGHTVPSVMISAADAITGKLNWTHSSAESSNLIILAESPRLLLSTGKVIYQYVNHQPSSTLSAINLKTGAIEWTKQILNGQTSSPIVPGNNNTLYLAELQGVTAIDSNSKGKVLWNYEMNRPTHVTLSADGKLVYASSETELVAIDSEMGTRVW
jgi:outer membrane protein assembly factor BamB